MFFFLTECVFFSKQVEAKEQRGEGGMLNSRLKTSHLRRKGKKNDRLSGITRYAPWKKLSRTKCDPISYQESHAANAAVAAVLAVAAAPTVVVAAEDGWQ